MMLETDAAHLLGQREQKIIAIIGMAAEQGFGFLHQSDMRSDLFLRRLQELGVIGDDIEMDATGQGDRLKILSGKDRAVDQCVIVGFFIDDAIAAGRFRAQRARRLPAIGIDGGRLDRDLADIIAGRVERDLMPAQIEHRRGHDDAALILHGRGDKLEGGRNLRDAFRHRQMEGKHIDIVAHPGERLAACGEFQSGELLDLAARGMVARQPFRIEQGERTGLGDGDGLGNAEYALVMIARVDLQLHRAGIGDILRGGNRVLGSDILRLAEMVGHGGGGGGKSQAQNKAQEGGGTHVNKSPELASRANDAF